MRKSELFFCIVFAVSLFMLGMAFDTASTFKEQQDDCYQIYGKGNITYETINDGIYLAYINNTLVYAGGRVITENNPYINYVLCE